MERRTRLLDGAHVQSKKRVTFCEEKTTVYYTHDDSDARRGRWVEDRLHFERRIQQMETLITPVLLDKFNKVQRLQTK